MIKNRVNTHIQCLKEKGYIDKTVGIFLYEHIINGRKHVVLQLELWRTKLRVSFNPYMDDYRVLIEEINQKDTNEIDSVEGEFYIEQDEIEKIIDAILKNYKIT